MDSLSTLVESGGEGVVVDDTVRGQGSVEVPLPDCERTSSARGQGGDSNDDARGMRIELASTSARSDRTVAMLSEENMEIVATVEASDGMGRERRQQGGRPCYSAAPIDGLIVARS